MSYRISVLKLASFITRHRILLSILANPCVIIQTPTPYDLHHHESVYQFTFGDVIARILQVNCIAHKMLSLPIVFIIYPAETVTKEGYVTPWIVTYRAPRSGRSPEPTPEHVTKLDVAQPDLS